MIVTENGDVFDKAVVRLLEIYESINIVKKCLQDLPGGEIVRPVEEITIAGNLGDILAQIDTVGSDLLWLSRVASPSLRVSRMTVAGA